MNVTARVQILVDVSLLQPWVGQETMDYLHRAASQRACEILTRMIMDNSPSSAHIRLIGDPKVFTVTTE